jgi:hypothetical protein
MKRQIVIDDYEFINGEISIFFEIGDLYYEDNIDEDLFEKYVDESGGLEYYEDCWDGYKESHYTKEYVHEYSEWLSEHFDKSYLNDFIDTYYKNNSLPEPIEE